MADDLPEYHRGSGRRGVSGQARWPEPAEGRNNVLVVTRGHPFAHDAFFDIFASNESIEWSAVEHPAAQRMFNPGFASHFDCYVLYDMPGITFRAGAAAEYYPPPSFYVDGLRAMLDDGFPLVIMHHACAAWPGWPEWADIVGSQFLYQPGPSRGVAMPDSGYVIDVSHTVTPVAEHPITAGIEPFELIDELYLAPVFEESVTPLFRSDYEFVADNFYSASLALRGRLNERDGWHHPPGSNLVGWIKRHRNSPIVYLQFGDGPPTYANPTFRRILANAIAWACSDEARQWALAR